MANLPPALRLMLPFLVEDAGRGRVDMLETVSRAKADGTCRPLRGQATIDVPEDLAAALAEHPTAKAMFDRLSAANRYAVLYRVTTAKRADTRQRRVEQLVAHARSGRDNPSATSRRPGEPVISEPGEVARHQ